MKELTTIGVVCLARKTFDFEAAEDIYKELQLKLDEIENVDWKFIPDLVIEIEEAKHAAHLLAKKEIDALVCISGTFALGHLILELNKVLESPILLWGLKELPYTGGKIRLNSVCGINLNASNLYKAQIRDYHVVVGDEIDEDWLDAIRIRKCLKSSHIGIVGYRAKGFFNLDVDELDLYDKLGVLIDHYELQEIFNYRTQQERVEKRKKEIKETFDVSGINQEQLTNVAQLVDKFDGFMNEHNLSALAIRCWPEFAGEYGISPCAAMSILQSEGKILTCEGDVLGSVSMLAHKAIGAKNPFLADFSQIDFEENFALLWHCGVAACDLWDGKCVRSLDSYFAGGRGVTADFVMKSGKISIARFDYSPPNEYRIYLQQAEGIPMEKKLKGTYLKVKFENNIKKVLDKIVENGIAHHISVVYGNYMRPFEIFAKLNHWKIIK